MKKRDVKTVTARIDHAGYQKYILVRVTNQGQTKLVVRTGDCLDQHIQILRVVQRDFSGATFKTLGGGYITISERTKTIEVGGTSKRFGTAEHDVSARLIRESYPDFEVVLLF